MQAREKRVTQSHQKIADKHHKLSQVTNCHQGPKPTTDYRITHAAVETSLSVSLPLAHTHTKPSSATNLLNYQLGLQDYAVTKDV